MREMPFQSIKFQKFFGGACPRTPLNCSLPCSDVQQIFPKSAPDQKVTGSIPVRNKMCLKLWFIRTCIQNYNEQSFNVLFYLHHLVYVSNNQMPFLKNLRNT